VQKGGSFEPPFCETVKEPLRWVLFDSLVPVCGPVSPDFLRKIRRVTVFLTIITQITAKNDLVGRAAFCPPLGSLEKAARLSRLFVYAFSSLITYFRVFQLPEK
jgi:hypothetical protein